MADLDVAIIGAGFGGLGMGIALKRDGVERFAIFEKADGVGGTWRANTYPGCACDVSSHLYSFSFEPNPRWSRMFAPQPEILAYLEHCTDKYGLRPHLRLNQTLGSLEWSDAKREWTVSLEGGETVTARAVVAGLGGLSRPSIPTLPGVEKFEGAVFHSARWRHDVPLDGKKVAVVGTGASAVQIVPYAQKLASKLTLFQRTPGWVLPKPDRAMRGYEQAMFAKVPATQAAVRAALHWHNELFSSGFIGDLPMLKPAQKLAELFLRTQVKDEALRQKLTPNFALGCKRVLLSNEYYPAVASPNVELVTEGIREVTATGVVDSTGREHPLDALILATGFRPTDLLAPLVIRGRGGVSVDEVWKKHGLQAYRGTTIAGFPNLFMLMGPNTALGASSVVLMIEAQVQYVRDALRVLRARGLDFVDVTPDAQASYNARLQKRLGRTVWASGCKSWYFDAHGKNSTTWPGLVTTFERQTQRFDAEAYHCEPAGPVRASVPRRLALAQ